MTTRGQIRAREQSENVQARRILARELATPTPATPTVLEDSDMSDPEEGDLSSPNGSESGDSESDEEDRRLTVYPEGRDSQGRASPASHYVDMPPRTPPAGTSTGGSGSRERPRRVK